MDESKAEAGAEGPPPAAPGEPKGAKRVFFWGVIAFIGAALSLLAGEIALRLVESKPVLTPAELESKLTQSEQTEVSVVASGNLRGLIQHSERPGVIYELKPSRRWEFKGAFTETNRHGFRGPDWAEAKGANTLRVVGLGDSVMFGWGVDQGATYMSLLERSLAGAIPGRAVEVLNCAVPGYNTSQELAVLEQQCLRFDPDVILVGYCLNDWVAPFFVKDPVKGGLIESSVLLKWIQERGREGAQRYFDRYQGMDKTVQALKDLSRLARERKLPVVFFVAPTPHAERDADEALRGLARELGFVNVEVTEALRRGHQLEDLVLSATDDHPNPAGHRLIAEALRPVLLDALRSRSGS